MFMEIETHGYKPAALPNDPDKIKCCIDCTDTLLSNSIKDIESWSDKQVKKLWAWRRSYSGYKQSDTYAKIKMANQITENNNDNLPV